MTIPTEQALSGRALDWADHLDLADELHGGADERPARASLRAQVARLERELSGIVAATFPHVRPLARAEGEPLAAPRLPTLGELERLRDELTVRVGRARAEAEGRAALAERSHALLEEMRREPSRHKLARVKVADLGEGRCGVWEVRPRLGLIGMLAGWWQVKLSSGCP
jgi:hypothetical protein